MDRDQAFLQQLYAAMILDLFVAVLRYKYGVRVCPLHGLEWLR